MRKFVAVAFAAPLLVAADLSTEEAARRFGAREAMWGMQVSPGGGKVSYLAPAGPRGTGLYVVPLETSTPGRAMASSGDPNTLDACEFVGDERLTCRVTVYGEDAGVGFTMNRLIGVSAAGGKIALLGQRASDYDERLRQNDGAILDTIAGDGTDVLMAREYIPEAGRIGSNISRKADGLAVDRVNTITLSSERVEPPVKNAFRYMTDGRGSVRLMGLSSYQGATRNVDPELVYKYRIEGEKEWRDFARYNSLTGVGSLPIAIDADLQAAYVLKKVNGRNALHRVKLDGTLAEELVYANPAVDVDGVVRAGDGRRVIGATFADERRRILYFDREHEAIGRQIAKALPDMPLIDITGADESGNKLLVHAGSDAHPGQYYLFDRVKKMLGKLGPVRPELEGVPLARVKPITYPAADGTRIPGYLTLPPGRENAKGLPAVVLPHGGPSARDEWGFDWLAQFLANRGYAVLQPNYRGSSGYGDAWFQQNGFQGWRVAIGDVSAGARWLTGEGIADPGRLAILGWSYGGYAALQSGVAEPGLYKALVAIAPVTDLQLLKTEADDYVGANLVREFVGSGPHIREGSPLQNVSAIRAPVLIFHGTRDLNVGVAHARRMHARLQSAGKASEYREFDKLGHSLVDSEARTAMLARIGAFLDEHVK